MTVLLTVLAALVPWALGLPDPPAPVQLWFAQEGPAVVQSSEASGLPPEQLVSVAVGMPLGVGTWDESFVAGREAVEAIVPTGEWVAPLTIEGAGIGALVGTSGEAGGITDHRVMWDQELGRALVGHPADTFILDTQTDGWFRLSGDLITPVTEQARDVLAGSIALTDYQSFLADRHRTDYVPPPLPAETDTAQLRPVLLTAGFALGVLVIVGAAVWIRRPEAS